MGGKKIVARSKKTEFIPHGWAVQEIKILFGGDIYRYIPVILYIQIGNDGRYSRVQKT